MAGPNHDRCLIFVDDTAEWHFVGYPETLVRTAPANENKNSISGSSSSSLIAPMIEIHSIVL